MWKRVHLLIFKGTLEQLNCRTATKKTDLIKGVLRYIILTGQSCHVIFYDIPCLTLIPPIPSPPKSVCVQFQKHFNI